MNEEIRQAVQQEIQAALREVRQASASLAECVSECKALMRRLGDSPVAWLQREVQGLPELRAEFAKLSRPDTELELRRLDAESRQVRMAMLLDGLRIVAPVAPMILARLPPEQLVAFAEKYGTTLSQNAAAVAAAAAEEVP